MNSTINFGPGRPWGGVSQREYQRMAHDPRHQLAYRIHFAALGWADRHGHASFGPGKLAALLGKEDKPLSDQSTNKALARARELELVSPRSGAACLALPSHAFQKRKGAPVPCRLHLDR
ncbi:hypothetical protein [Streptomyces yangpuensis]|uniref:hypothetical protein n=1 Tax=Streptomyces yangpuensis TaxID=1648182 RepID=UPI0038071BBF